MQSQTAIHCDTPFHLLAGACELEDAERLLPVFASSAMEVFPFQVAAAVQRLKDYFGMPEFIARFGKFNYGIFAFNALTPEILRRITRKFMEDKIRSFATLNQRDRSNFFAPPEIRIVRYADEVVEYALRQTPLGTERGRSATSWTACSTTPMPVR